MKILIAPDKFKGSLTAPEVADAIAAGIARADPSIQLDLCPMADGGEGTVAALVRATGGRTVSRTVTGPLAEMKVRAEMGFLGNSQTAVIEMAAASGLALLKDEDRNPLYTTTFGTGELLLAAAEMGASRIILGIGGSATCDAGVGCAQGAGLTVLSIDGSPIAPTEPLAGRDLDQVLLVKHGRGSRIDRVKFLVACDVTNPLYGETGAAKIYGPQKGASPDEVEQLDQMLRRLVWRLGKEAEANTPGAGAAGGLGFGMLAFFGAKLQPGIQIVIDAVNLRQRLRGTDLCITGEGKLDASTLSGKTPAGVARLCQQMHIPCVVMAGMVDPSPEMTSLFSRIIPLQSSQMPPNHSIAHAADLLTTAAENLIQSLPLGQRSR